MPKCDVCHNECNLTEGATGLCHARKYENGSFKCANYGHITSIALDPIEKKPLNHFYPGSMIVSVGSYGCNLRCPFCDTDFSEYREMSAEDIVETIKVVPTRFVVLTGGEPSLQVDQALVEALHRHNQTIAIETNGTHEIPDGIDWVTVSPKADGTVVLNRADEVKLVFTNQPVTDIQHWLTAIRASHYYLQPCSCSNTEEVIAYILAHPEWRLSLQTQKYIHIR